MNQHPLSALLRFLQRYLLLLLLGCYLAGAFAPQAGSALRGASAGSLHVFGSKLELTVPTLMLSFLLFSAGVATRVDGLRQLARRPQMLVVGLLVNSLLPVVYAAVVAGALRAWPEREEVESLLMGLALLGAMPIAGASTAWAQNCDGNLALSLGLVLSSTLLSPLSTPLVLGAIAKLTSGDYAEDLLMLAQPSTQLFLAATIAIPSMLGIAVRSTVARSLAEHALPWLKLLNLLALLALNYSNAALTLPAVVSAPDFDFGLLVVAVVALLCASAFWLGAAVARFFRGTSADVASLMFGLGMNNNGTALVLAAAAVSDHTDAIIPILVYNIVQQIAAGIVDARMRRRRDAARAGCPGSGFEPTGQRSTP